MLAFSRLRESGEIDRNEKHVRTGEREIPRVLFTCSLSIYVLSLGGLNGVVALTVNGF